MSKSQLISDFINKFVEICKEQNYSFTNQTESKFKHFLYSLPDEKLEIVIMKGPAKILEHMAKK